MAPPPPELNGLQPTAIEADTTIDISPWSLDLTAEQIDGMVEYMTAYAAERGQQLITEGVRGTYMGLILTGWVDILKEDSSGTSKQIARMGPGKMIGEMGLVDGGPRSASVVAHTDTTLLVMTQFAFRRMSEEKPRLALKIMMTLAKIGSQRLRMTSGKLIEFLPPDGQFATAKTQPSGTHST